MFAIGSCGQCPSVARRMKGENCGRRNHHPARLPNQSAHGTGRARRKYAGSPVYRTRTIAGFLEEWTQSGETCNRDRQLFKGHFGEPSATGTSRAPPYFGFEIPDSPSYWYVWLAHRLLHGLDAAMV
jgi:methionyl-tRNA synthetase